MDLEEGVRLGSLCADGDTVGRAPAARGCPVADDVVAELQRVEHARGEQVEPAASLCLYTSLTESYVEGHVVFMRSALRHTPYLGAHKPPLYVLEQGLSPEARGRVDAAYSPTRYVSPERGGKDVRVVTKFALNKEKTALFGLRAECGRVLKIDTGDMLVLGDLQELLQWQPGLQVWAAQALGQPEGKINGGLMLFGRFWLHKLTQARLEERAALESREQSLFGGFFARHFALLPKRFNVEQRFWDSSAELARWRALELQTHGVRAVPSLEQATVLHFVGRDKPWQRIDRLGPNPDTATDMCRRLRNHDAENCAQYLSLQALWWREFGQGTCIVVGDGARGRAQGFVIEQFEHVLRMHGVQSDVDVGNQTRGRRCADASACSAVARSLGCVLHKLGVKERLGGARDVMQVFQRKLGVFGGPMASAP